MNLHREDNERMRNLAEALLLISDALAALAAVLAADESGEAIMALNRPRFEGGEN